MVAEATLLDSAIQLRVEGDPLDAPDAAPGLLTRIKATERALRNSPELQAALAEVRGGLAEAKQARLLANPVLDLNVRFPTESGDEVIEAGLSQPLIDLLTRPARSRATDARLRASAQRVVLEAIDVLRETRRAYADALAAEAQLDVLDQQADLLDRLLEMAEARQRGGEASKLDVVGFRARRAALDTRSIRVRAQRRAARLTLARLIGRPSGDAEFELEPAEESRALAPEREYLRTALAARPEVQAMVFELAALGEQVTLAGFTPFDGMSAGVEAESEDETSIGPSISVPIPIFDFGGNAKERARAEVLAARHRLTGVSRLVIEEVRQALTAALAAAESVSAITDTLLPLQRDRVEQTRAAYRAGFADVTAVLQAEQDLLDAEAELIDARFRRQIADADLDRAAGGAGADDAATQPTPATSRKIQ